MLKSAVEMAAAARAARASAQEEKLAEQEKLAQATQLQARLDVIHRAFEGQAFEAARKGELSIAARGHELSQSRLKAQGFIVAALSRRATFEEHLAKTVETKSEELARLAEMAVAACPGLERVDGDALLHRNPVISLLETLWRKPQIAKPYDLELLMAFARIHSAAKHSDLEANKGQLANILKLYAQVKATEEKFCKVRWENLTIPRDTDKATYVSWESADDGQGLVLKFSAQRLQWLATKWPSIAESLCAVIEEAATEGESELDIFTWRTSQGWDMSWDWPPGGDCQEDSDLPLDAQTTGIWEGEKFCAPELAREELSVAGYSVSIQPQPIECVPIVAPSAEKLDACSGTAYKLTIRWV